MGNDRDRKGDGDFIAEYLKKDGSLTELFEDYIELNSFGELVDEVLTKTVDNLLAGDGLERPVKAWLSAERSFPELRMIRILSLASDEDIDRFCKHNNLSEIQSMNLSAWIFGYGRILQEVFRKASLRDISMMNPFTKVDFDPFWPTKHALRIYLRIYGEDTSFETVDSPSRLFEMALFIIEAVGNSFKWKGTTVKEYRKSLAVVKKLRAYMDRLEENLNRDMNELVEHLKGVGPEELTERE